MPIGPRLTTVTEELERQPALLDSICKDHFPEAPMGSLMVGAGDSLAAATCLSFMSASRLAGFDPCSLMRVAEVSRGRSVYIFSTSGRTSANVELARRLKGIASERIAVTCDPASPLAKAVDSVLAIPFKPLPKSPGVAAFTLSLLVAMKLGAVEIPKGFLRAFAASKELARRLLVSSPGTTFLLGNNELYATSIYGAAKIYEFTGGKAHPQFTEEFSHMELFSLSRRDAVNILAPEDGDDREERLSQVLDKNGYTSSLITIGGDLPSERVFTAVFSLQRAALEAARRNELDRPYFQSARTKLRISDAMIY